uniref:Uncharacterized protein n=1 Tax=Chelydra serpentina TaxID=8475 RepID=A0A8C3ST72_CHESE
LSASVSLLCSGDSSTAPHGGWGWEGYISPLCVTGIFTYDAVSCMNCNVSRPACFGYNCEDSPNFWVFFLSWLLLPPSPCPDFSHLLSGHPIHRCVQPFPFFNRSSEEWEAALKGLFDYM